MISSLERGVDSEVEMLNLTCKTCEKGVKFTFFGGNGGMSDTHSIYTCIRSQAGECLTLIQFTLASDHKRGNV